MHVLFKVQVMQILAAKSSSIHASTKNPLIWHRKSGCEQKRHANPLYDATQPAECGTEDE